MKINKINFTYDNKVTDIAMIDDQYVVPIDESHPLGKFLNTMEMAPIVGEGFRYDLFGMDPNVPDNLLQYQLPTGVDFTKNVKHTVHRAYLFDTILVYYLGGLSNPVTELDYYGFDGELMFTVTDFSSTDKLVLVYDTLPDQTGLHRRSRTPHKYTKKFLNQDIITNSGRLPQNKNKLKVDYIPSSFTVVNSLKRIKYGYGYTDLGKKYEITRDRSYPYLPVEHNNTY